MRVQQQYLQLGSGGGGAHARPGRLPMREEAPPPTDHDARVRIIYVTLATFLTSCADRPSMAAFIAANAEALKVLEQLAPARLAALRQIYRLHRDSLVPIAIDAAALSTLPNGVGEVPAGAGMRDPEGDDDG